MNRVVEKNSEILFLYDAVLTNPNGDPDDENRPRMDIVSRRNLVSDVRLKRYIRDYLYEIKGKDIFIRKSQGETVNSTKRLVEWYKNNYPDDTELGEKDIIKKLTKLAKESPVEFIKGIRNELIDIRMFGGTFTIRGGGRGEGGEGISLTGAVQFSWGYSLNPVEINPSASITSQFSSTGEEGHGAIGKDWRVLYSFLAFYGVVAANWAKDKENGKLGTGLREEDIKELEEALIKAIPIIGATRSKVGETPRLLLRIQYKDSETLFGDLREYIRLESVDNRPLEEVRTVKDVLLDMGELKKLIEENRERIEKIYYWKHEHLQVKNWDINQELLENLA